MKNNNNGASFGSNLKTALFNNKVILLFTVLCRLALYLHLDL